MTVSVIPAASGTALIQPSTDTAFDYEAHDGMTTRWKADSTGVFGRFAFGPFGLGLRLLGFTATNERAVGNILSFAASGANAMITYRVESGRVKERIKLTAIPPVSRIDIAVTPVNVHVEQAADGGLWAVSNTDGSFLARVPAPTCVDAKGVSGPARWALSPDGLTISLVLDAAWLATAAYPVYIDPTVVTSSTLTGALISPRGQGPFRMSDGKLAVYWVNVATSPSHILRSTSADAGVTWSAPVDPFGGLSGNAKWLTMTQNGDNIYGATDAGTAGFNLLKSVYSAGAFTDSVANLAYPGGAYNADSNEADCWYDTVKAAFHFATWMRAAASPDVSPVVACNMGTMTVIAGINAASSTNVGFNNPLAIAIDTAATPNVYVAYDTLTGASSPTLQISRLTFNGTAYTFGGNETAVLYSGTSLLDVDLAFDQNGNLDIFYVDSGGLKTIKRTGVNTYSAVTTLVASGVGLASKDDPKNQEISISRTGNVNADLYVVYQTTASQTNGEIYQIKRVNGSWQAAALVAGGNNTGWRNPSPIQTIQSDAKVHMVYLTGTATFAITYDGTLLTGSAPSAPINVLPTGNANTSLTPSCSATYKNTASSDALGKYRFLVTRVSDGVVFWDTGAVAAPGAPTVAAGAAGLPNGAYRYAITFVTQVDAVTTGETASGTETAPFTLTNQQGSLSAIPTGPAGTIKRGVYRTLAGGAAGTEKLVGYINDNTTTTYLDNIADGSLGAAIPTVSTAQLGTSWGGATVTDGGTFSVTYAGTALVKDTAYQIQAMTWDSLGNLKGPLSVAVQFKIEDAPVVTITGPTPFAAVPTSGPTVTWTYAQTLNHVQASYRVQIKDAGNVNTLWDSGVVNSAATSVVVPNGTLVNGTTYQCVVTATSTDGL